MVYAGLLFILFVMIAVSVYSSHLVKRSGYSAKRSASTILVMGGIVGTFVGGSSTIGTSQAAFSLGISACWFSVGCTLGLLVFGLVFSKGIYESGFNTLPELVASRYGKSAGVAMSLMCAIGTLIGLVAQVLSGTALLSAIVPTGSLGALMIFFFLVLLYVFFGGGVSLGYMGIVKTVLMLLGIGGSGIIAFSALRGGVLSSLPAEPYFNILGGGAAKDISKTLVLIAGIITGQNYTSALITGRSYREARKGVLLASFFGPLSGICCTTIGLYMKIYHPDIAPGMALPLFIQLNVPAFLAGCLDAMIILALVGATASGLFASATVFYRGLLKERWSNETKATRLLLLLFLVLICLFGLGKLGDMILAWSFLGMGLRGAASFFPIVLVLFIKKQMESRYVLYSMFAAPICTFLGDFFFSSLGIHSAVYGLLGSLFFLSLGYFHKKGE